MARYLKSEPERGERTDRMHRRTISIDKSTLRTDVRIKSTLRTDVRIEGETYVALDGLPLRCGSRAREKHMWRWTGFHYGVDLVMIADDRSLIVKRNHRPEFEQLLSLQTIRHVDIRVTVYTLNEQRQVTFCQCSGIKHLPLEKGEEVTLLTFDQINFPLVISANILFLTPGDKDSVLDLIQTIV
ncbi:hypothetical protein QE152_g23397 [Popillia japonica]|uniref:Uncharacterized protein n=1 Tax=Popillia japonica TaxID=7064 RepID=A0AAW1KHF5_POPJA